MREEKDSGLLNHMTENELSYEAMVQANIVLGRYGMKNSSKNRDAAVMWKTLEKPGLEISVPLWSLVFKKDEHRLELENNTESLLIDRRKKKNC